MADDHFTSNYKNSSSLCDSNEDKVVCEIDLLRSYAATDYSPIDVQVVFQVRFVMDMKWLSSLVLHCIILLWHAIYKGFLGITQNQ